MRARLYRFVFSRYRKAPFESRRSNLWWWLSCAIEQRPTPETEFHIHSSSLGDTPESFYIVDRLQNFGRGHHGDIELYNDPVLLVERELTQRLEDSILYGTSTE